MGVVSERVRPFFVPENVCAGKNEGIRSYSRTKNWARLVGKGGIKSVSFETYLIPCGTKTVEACNRLYTMWNKERCNLQQALHHVG